MIWFRISFTWKGHYAPLQTCNPHPNSAHNSQISAATAIHDAMPCPVAAGSKNQLRAAIAAATAAIDNIDIH
jgi:hypothetical protein